MTKQVVKQPMTFDQAELNARMEKAEDSYRKSFNSAIRVSAPFSIFVTLLQNHILEGRRVHASSPALILGSEVFCYVSKNESEITEDLIKIKEEVTTKYQQEIEADLQKNISILTEQLVAQELKKEQQVQEKKDADRRAKALALAVEHFTQTTKTQ